MHLLFNLYRRFFADKAGDFRIFVGRIAEFQLLYSCNGFFREFVFQRIVNDKALACAAYLSGIVHAPPHELFDRQIDVSVVQHDERVVSAQFKRRVRKVCGRLYRRIDSDFGASRQRNQADPLVGNGVTFYGAGSRNALDRTVGYARFDEQFRQPHQCQRIVG